MFHELSRSATIDRLLRRTLVRAVRKWIRKTFQIIPCFYVPSIKRSPHTGGLA
jgi:hypothetical protein